MHLLEQLVIGGNCSVYPLLSSFLTNKNNVQFTNIPEEERYVMIQKFSSHNR